MNLLDLDMSDSIPDIINAYTKVFGTEYKDIIEKRLNRIVYVMYNDVDGMYSYLDFLKDCKQKELAIKFLEEIGIDIGTAKEKSYAEELDDDIIQIINKYIGSYFGMVPEYKNASVGIKAWKSFSKEADVNVELIEAQKIKFINFLRGENANTITKETFQTFCKTDEYKQILEKIEKYLQIFDQISEEYEDYLQEIASYQKYVDEELKRRDDMQNNRRNILYEQIEENLTDDIKAFLDEKYSSIDEKNEAFFGTELGEKTYAEYFSQEDENKLSDLSVNESDKNNIYYYRTEYFKQLGVTIDKESWDFKNDKEFYEYCIQQENIKKLILPAELATDLTSKRKETYEGFQKDFIYNSQDFIGIAKAFGNSTSDKEEIYLKKKEKKVCIAGGTDDKGFLPILFFTVKDWSSGRLDYMFLHEICHVIEAEGSSGKNYRCGFDSVNDNISLNSYNGQYRKYERLNETITDIFAIEARKALHEKGIYIFEPQKLNDPNVNDNNTHSIVKNLLTTFLNKYRQPIVRARMLGKVNELYDIIGEENFEELNDVVNKVDSLVEKNNENEDTIVIEYYKQLERLKQTYDKMEKHQSRNLSSDNLLKSAISATEETTRSGQINEGINNITSKLKNNEKNRDSLEGEEISG